MTSPCLTGFMISRRNLEMEGLGHPPLVQLPLPFHLGPAAPSFWHLSYSNWGLRRRCHDFKRPNHWGRKATKNQWLQWRGSMLPSYFCPPKAIKKLRKTESKERKNGRACCVDRWPGCRWVSVCGNNVATMWRQYVATLWICSILPAQTKEPTTCQQTWKSHGDWKGE